MVREFHGRTVPSTRGPGENGISYPRPASRESPLSRGPTPTTADRPESRGADGEPRVTKIRQSTIDRLSTPKYRKERYQNDPDRKKHAWRPSGGGTVIMTDTGYPEQKQFFSPYTPLLPTEQPAWVPWSPEPPSPMNVAGHDDDDAYSHLNVYGASSEAGYARTSLKFDANAKGGPVDLDDNEGAAAGVDSWRRLEYVELADQVLRAVREANVTTLRELKDAAKQCPALGAMHGHLGWYDPLIPRWFLLFCRGRRSKMIQHGFSWDFDEDEVHASTIRPWSDYETENLNLYAIIRYEHAREAATQKQVIAMAKRALEECELYGGYQDMAQKEGIIAKRKSYLEQSTKLLADLRKMHAEQITYLQEEEGLTPDKKLELNARREAENEKYAVVDESLKKWSAADVFSQAMSTMP